MTEGFSSNALEVNLAKTREAELAIPEEQEWFVSLSSSKWGIHKRTSEFIQELNHQYRNDMYVIDALHNICLTDLWFYNSLDESEKAFSVLLNIFRDFFKAKMDEAARELLIKTLVKFIERLSGLEDYPPQIVKEALDIIAATMDEYEIHYIRHSGYFKTYLGKVALIDDFSQTILTITKDLLKRTINFWENTSDAEAWYGSKSHLLRQMDKKTISKIGKPFFAQLREALDQAQDWKDLESLMFYNDISNYFRNFTEQFDSYLETIYYLYFLLHLPGMAHLNDHLLYDINRNLRNVFTELDKDHVPAFIDTIMEQFEDLNRLHGGTVLDCIITLGKEITDTKDQETISYFIKGLEGLGFNHPGAMSLNKDWQIKINSNHVKNIRAWLELIEYDPSSMGELLAALIVNLKLGGIFISDTDLFQRDVTKLLNSPISTVYREMKQLARIFPVYFRDIGAEGKLREISTAIDELSHRKDRLIHFLRKQTHTESNNTHIDLTASIMEYWYSGDKDLLKPLVPEDVYRWLGNDKEWLDHVKAILEELSSKLNMLPLAMLKQETEVIEQLLSEAKAGNERDRKRVLYLFQLYALLSEKYSLESEDFLQMLKGSTVFAEGNIKLLENNLKDNDLRGAVKELYGFMNQLKEVILDPRQSEAMENIYYKRHIAAGIPSMYGQYIEPKFEALGMMYRLEKTTSKLMVRLMDTISTDYITARTFRNIYSVLELFRQGLEIDGIYNQGMNSHLDMLKYSLTSPSFSLDQYINIFQFMASDIKQIISEYFFDVYENSLKNIIPKIHQDAMKDMDKLERQQFFHMESERFLRDNLASAFLVQDLDNFIANLLGNLRVLLDSYSPELIENMMTYDPDLSFSQLDSRSEIVDNPVFLGAKAFFLKKLIEYDFPVPPGFILTTEVFRHLDTLTTHQSLNSQFIRVMKRHVHMVERASGKTYGDPDNPLFFSVRSGSSISMPGAMKTFLNVGMNDEIAESLSKKEGYGWMAWDSYRRFLQSWGMAHDIDRDLFDKIMIDHKNRWGVEFKIQFTPDQMREMAFDYKALLMDHKVYIEEEPISQLRKAITSVLDSWSSKSAIYYRNHMQIADEWGTAVLVQQMAMGNISDRSGTGVLFTSSPFNSKAGINLYGDFTLCGQGEDVVAGLVNTLPISETQRKSHYTDAGISLESAFPEIYDKLLEYATKLIQQYGFVHQEIEFTFESEKPEDLYILQTRNQKFKKQTTLETFALPFHEMKLVGRGLGVSSGILSGKLAFDMKDLLGFKKDYPKESIILVRPDTVPDDIPLIFNCDGLVTGKGGTTSHAAVAAAGLGKVCIVNCKGMIVDDDKKLCTFNGHIFKSGDSISIDGDSGNIYEGSYEIQTVD